MRKPAEAGDDIQMHLCIVDHLVLPHGSKQGNTTVLRVDVFRMFEWHDEPKGKRWWQHLVKASANKCLGQGQRFGISRKCKRTAPMNIARNLIEQDDETQRTFRCFAPMIEGAKPSLPQSATETDGERAIKGGVLGELPLRPRQHPEIHNGFGVHVTSALA